MVSKGGGTWPMWRGDGKQLFYETPTGQFLSVDITAGATFQPGVPKLLFQIQGGITNSTYAMTSDGKKFLFLVQQLGNTPAPFTVLVNWEAGLKR